MQINQAWDPALESFHPLRKSIAQAVDDLEQREVDIADPAAGDPGTAAFAEQPFEIAGKFWNPLVPEFFRAFFRRASLIVVIEAWAERMMGVMNFHDEVGDGELQLMHPQPAGLRLRRQA